MPLAMRAETVMTERILSESLSVRDQTSPKSTSSLSDDIRLQRALRVTPSIGFYRYQIAFRLFPSQ